MCDDLVRAPLADAVHQSIQDAFKAIPDGKRGALLVVADMNGARALVAANINGNWKISAEAAKPWNGPVTATVSVIGSW